MTAEHRSSHESSSGRTPGRIRRLSQAIWGLMNTHERHRRHEQEQLDAAQAREEQSRAVAGTLKPLELPAGASTDPEGWLKKPTTTLVTPLGGSLAGALEKRRAHSPAMRQSGAESADRAPGTGGPATAEKEQTSTAAPQYVALRGITAASKRSTLGGRPVGEYPRRLSGVLGDNVGEGVPTPGPWAVVGNESAGWPEGQRSDTDLPVIDQRYQPPVSPPDVDPLKH